MIVGTATAAVVGGESVRQPPTEVRVGTTETTGTTVVRLFTEVDSTLRDQHRRSVRAAHVDVSTRELTVTVTRPARVIGSVIGTCTLSTRELTRDVR